MAWVKFVREDIEIEVEDGYRYWRRRFRQD